MKLIFTILITLLAVATASAGSVITATADGDWATASTWNLNRKPQSGDTIVIPAGRTISFTTTESLNGIIIKIAGTLNMSGASKLNLDNASLIKVYPGGTITGQSNSDQISIGTTHVFKGASPAIAGPQYADNTTGSGFAPMSVMPVIFTTFYVTKENSDIKISWSTATEINNSHFEVERSYDGINFILIGIVASVGNSTSISNYSYTDKKMNADLAYYRIKQVDIDGTAMYTAIASIRNNQAQSASPEIFAGTHKNITVRFNSLQSSVTVKVWMMSGQAVMQQTFTQSNYISFGLTNAMPAIYVVQVIDQNKKSESRKISLN